MKRYITVEPISSYKRPFSCFYLILLPLHSMTTAFLMPQVWQKDERPISVPHPIHLLIHFRVVVYTSPRCRRRKNRK